MLSNKTWFCFSLLFFSGRTFLRETFFLFSRFLFWASFTDWNRWWYWTSFNQCRDSYIVERFRNLFSLLRKSPCFLFLSLVFRSFTRCFSWTLKQSSTVDKALFVLNASNVVTSLWTILVFIATGIEFSLSMENFWGKLESLKKEFRTLWSM